MEYQLSNIILQTPIHVWALFIFLLFIGMNALVSKELSISRLMIIPFSFMTWSIFSIYKSYGTNFLLWALWLICCTVGFLILFFYTSKQKFKINYENNKILIPGSYFSLIFSMSFFIFKYSINVCYAINPSLKMIPSFFILDIIISAIISGLFLGKTLGIIIQYLKNYLKIN
jgi:hypothetical protein